MRIDLVAKNRFAYRYENSAAAHLLPLLEKEGISVRRLYLDEGTLFYEMEKERPDWILLLDTPWEYRGIADCFQCPTFHWERGLISPRLLAESPYAKVGYSDPSLIHPRVNFLPPGVSAPLREERERPFDLIMFGSLFEEENFLSCIDRLYGRKEAMGEEDLLVAREKMRENAFLWEFASHFSLPLHLFGEHVGKKLLTRFPKTLFLHGLHGQHAHLEAERLLTQAKILLIHQETEAIDPFLFPALFSGSLVLINENRYLRELLPEEEGCFYPKYDRKSLEKKAQYYLDHPEKRKALVTRLQEKLFPHVSWQKRTKEFIRIIQC